MERTAPPENASRIGFRIRQRDAKHVDAFAPEFMHGRPRILDKIPAVVHIDVGWFAVRDDQQQATIGFLPGEIVARVADHGQTGGKIAGQAGQPAKGEIAERLSESLIRV